MLIAVTVRFLANKSWYFNNIWNKNAQHVKLILTFYKILASPGNIVAIFEIKSKFIFQFFSL